MAWYDGTSKRDFSELEKENEKVCEGLYRSKAGDALFFVNSFQEGSELYAISDPHKEGEDHNYVFYHAFLGEEAEKAKEAIDEFLSKGYGEKEASIELCKADPERFISYGYGTINRFLLSKQEDLKELLPESVRSKGCFLVPLSICRFACPVCGRKTLEQRGMWEICDECGWEDEGDVGNDEECESAANGCATIKEARRGYLSTKLKCPDYKWFHGPMQDPAMPMPRAAAIYEAITLGERFIIQYDHYFRSPSPEKETEHISEMDELYQKARKIVIEPSGKKLDRTQMNDWFLTAGSHPKEFLEGDEEIQSYDDFCNHLLVENDVSAALLKAKKQGNRR